MWLLYLIRYFQQADNSTDDLEVRVTLLEDDVTDLQDEVEETETDINQLDDGLLLVEGIAIENSNDIDGKPVRWSFRTLHSPISFIRYI